MKELEKVSCVSFVCGRKVKIEEQLCVRMARLGDRFNSKSLEGIKGELDISKFTKTIG